MTGWRYVGWIRPPRSDSMLPLWAGVPDPKPRPVAGEKDYYCRPRSTVLGCQPARFARKKLPIWSAALPTCLESDDCRRSFAYGYREQAAILVSRIMRESIENLKRVIRFTGYTRLIVARGSGPQCFGWMAPTGVFLETLGVRIYTAKPGISRRIQSISLASYGKISRTDCLAKER